MRSFTGFFIAVILSMACMSNALGQEGVTDNMLPILVHGKWAS